MADNIDTAIQLLQQQGKSPSPAAPVTNDPIANAMQLLQGGKAPPQLSQAAPSIYNQKTTEAIDRMTNGGFGSGISKLAYNMGDAVSSAASHFLPPEGAAALGTAANVGIEAIPSFVGGGWAGKAEGALQGAGRYFMQSAIRPLVSDLQRGKVPQAVETMLTQGYSPTNAGVAAMQNKAAEYSGQVKDILDQSNKVIPVSGASDNAAKLADKLRFGTQGPQKVEDVQNVVKQLYNHPAVDDAGLISAQDAQAMKQANYRDIGPSGYGLGLKEQTNRDSLKAITAALRQGIEDAHPEVADLNAKAGDLINAAKVSQRRALIEGNKDLLPIGAGVATALHNPAAALGLWANSSSAAKAMIARALYSGSRAIPRAVGNIAGLVAGATTGTPPNSRDQIANALRTQ